MTDNLQLQTNRITNASAGNLIDDSLADIENCIRVLWGITADAPISQVMSITAAGNVTMIGNLTLAGAPTVDAHCATKKYADDNAGAGVGLEYKVLVGLSSSQTVAATDTDALSWDTAYVEDGDTAQWDFSDPTKLVCKSAGDYIVFGHIEAQLASGSTYYKWGASLLKNGGAFLGILVTASTNSVDPGTAPFCVMVTLAENDYLELQFENGGPWTDMNVLHGSGGIDGTVFGMVKVS